MDTESKQWRNREKAGKGKAHVSVREEEGSGIEKLLNISVPKEETHPCPRCSFSFLVQLCGSSDT